MTGMKRIFALVALLVLIAALPALAQRANDKPRVSPSASVSQNIGTTVVTIDYGRPGVKGRTILGELIPYGKVWRAGADEATTFETTGDVMVEGQRLPAGKYAFFAIPNEGSWTLIFNKVAKQWGAFRYDQAQDQLRVDVKPGTGDHAEWLTYVFKDIGPDGASAVIKWEKTAVSFKISPAS